VQANAYLTPPVAQGLRIHADAHDVFALQTHGHKQWVVYEDGDDTPSLDTALHPGDCLYLPKGTRHAARTVDSPSIHLTIGVRALTWADVLRPLLDEALDTSAVGAALPAGFAHDPKALAGEAGQRLAEVAERLRTSDAEDGLRRTARRFWAGRVPVLSGLFPQLLGLHEMDDRTVVRRRPGTSADVHRDDDRIAIALPDRTVRMPVAAEPALRAVLALDSFTVADLADHLDEPGRLTLVRRLVLEGLLTVVDG
jgi:bifunctional lysine-specific demethylase and histidyl-hydroxylase NO66